MDPKLPFLGGPFLSQVYLVVDYETGIFSLAPIDRSSTGTKGLVTLGCDKRSVPLPPTTITPLVPIRRSKVGPIVGGVVGGVVLLAVIAGLILFCRRRRRNNAGASTEAEIVPGPTKEQIEAHHAGLQPYDAPPAFSPSPSPGPYSPPNSPGPYGAMGMASVMRRPIPGQDQYPQTGSPPPGHNGYYDGQQYHMSSRTSEPVELKGTEVVSELSGSQPRTYSGTYDGGSTVSGQAGNR